MIEVNWADFSAYLYCEKKLDRSNDSSYRGRFNAISTFYYDCLFDRQNTLRFFAELQAKGLSNSTLNNYLKELKHLTHFLGLNFLDDYTYFKKQYPAHRLLAVEEVKKILNSYMEKGYNKDSKKINYRFYAVFHLLCVTGCRVGEVCNLEWKEIGPHQIIIKASTNKVDRGRIIPIRQETYDILSNLEKYDHGYIFGDYRGPMTSKWFNEEFKARAKYVGVKSPETLHAHQTRYFAAVNWKKAGVQIDVISKLLGHQSIETTVRFYQDYPSDEMEDAVGLSPILTNSISFDLVRRKFKSLSDFVNTTPFPLRADLSGDLIILQVENRVK